MIRKIIIYSLAGISLGVILMLLPIAFFFYSAEISITSSENLAEKNATESNLAASETLYKTRGSSLSEAAQIYGRSEAFQERFPSTILAPLMLAAASGLIAGITVIVIIKKTSWLK